MRQLPRGTVTFLFTDIEASTELTRRLGHAFGDVRGEHRSLVRAAVAEHDGHEIDTEGDGFFAAFERASDAVAAAAAAQRSVAAADWPEAGRVSVRMGIHTTEPFLHEEGYVGVGVSRAARICAAAHGGQIVLSHATAGVVEDLSVPGIRLRDLGEHRLKDIPQSQRLFQADVDGLPNEFPPLKVIGAARSVATLLVTDLVGYGDTMRTFGDDAAVAVGAAYHRVVVEIVEEHDGRALEVAGDSVLALFARAKDAVFAAAATVEAVRNSDWILAVDRPEVRVAVHSGRIADPDARQLGTPAIYVFRLCAEAAPSQVLVSDTTQALLEGEPLAPLALRDAGERAISDDQAPRRVFEVVAVSPDRRR